MKKRNRKRIHVDKVHVQEFHIPGQSIHVPEHHVPTMDIHIPGHHVPEIAH